MSKEDPGFYLSLYVNTSMWQMQQANRYLISSRVGSRKTIDAERRCCFAHMLSASQYEAAFEDLVRQLDENEAAAASPPPKAAIARRQSLDLQQLFPMAPAPVAKLEQPLSPPQGGS